MNSLLITTIISLSVLGSVLAIILYVVAQKFKVIEDPRIDDVEQSLPGANCGGCGYPGCRGFAEACVKAESLDSFFCPVGGNDTMKAVASVLGKEAIEKEPQVAVIRCNGTYANRHKTSVYDGAKTCAISNSLFSGETGCQFGCLGLGDCVSVCTFDAIKMNEDTGLPVVDEDKCTSCGACVKACPKLIIELRNKGKKNRRIFVSCISTEKGGIAKRHCEVACTGCTKCVKVCNFDAVKVENNLAYIDFNKCTLCRKCVEECPMNVIHEINMPPRRKKVEHEEAKEVVSN